MIEWKRLKRAVMPLCVGCAAILSMGVQQCSPEDAQTALFDPEAFQKLQEPPKAVVSVHSIVRYRRGELLEVFIPSYFGEEVCINKNQLIDSEDIQEIIAMPIANDPGFYNLKLKLTDRGRKMWIGLSVPNKKNYLAFVVDGMFYRGFIPRQIYDDSSVEIIVDGPFDQATALEVQNNSKLNYKKKKKTL